jgi:hypothetical protein
VKDKLLAAIIKTFARNILLVYWCMHFLSVANTQKLYFWNPAYMYLKSKTTFHPTVSELPYSFET